MTPSASFAKVRAQLMARFSVGPAPRFFLAGLVLAGLVTACAGASPSAEAPAEPAPSTPATAPAAAEPAPPTSRAPSYTPDDGRGGRIYDRFYDPQTFTPDSKKTPGVADGKGGPLGNGTLPLADGAPLLNDAGHDYRLKNFFGWDLRGADGIYGARYQNKSYVVPINLLDAARPAETLAATLTRGEGALPAYGDALAQEDIDAVVNLVVGIREGHLPGPERIWALSEGTPGNYRLNTGADPARGKQLFADRCSSCHGNGGANLLFDDGEFSLGTHARQKAYEDWFKILSGQPGTSMKRFVDGDGAEMGRQILDLLAALCDRTAFPKGKAKGSDVPNGDPRCGEYLK